ncbi:MAG TPA: lytic transglycosylase domain-containing protein [Longimicrobiales bacterium]|nr:lytic transglycosylase domain-containing protein [Longimicrobiales bacterium]
MSRWTNFAQAAHAAGQRARTRAARRIPGGLRVRLALALALTVPAVLVSARAPDPGAEALYAAAPATDPVAEAWRQGVLDREREALAVWIASRFDIPKDLAGQIYRAAEAERVDPGVAFHLVRVESSFRRTAVSHAGAVGYTQVLPSTARWLVPSTTRTQLFQSDTNLRIGFRYLRYLLDYYDGDVRLALTAYNRGPGTVDRLLKRGQSPENGYARRVLGT